VTKCYCCFLVCKLLEEEKWENTCVRKLLRLANERAQEEKESTLRALKLTESVLTDDQRQQIACKFNLHRDTLHLIKLVVLLSDRWLQQIS